MTNQMITPGSEMCTLSPPVDSTKSTLTGVVLAALEISQRRRDTMRRLKAALEGGDDAGALEIARELCGIDHDERNRTNTHIN